MSQDHTLMASRFENKYLVTREMSWRIRDFVQQHLVVDEYGIGKEENSYPVHSLYLDSDDWEISRRTGNGDKNRFKLRLRYYNDDPLSPIFFEIKRRMDNIIMKKRAPVPRQFVQQALAGHLPPPHLLFRRDIGDDFAALHDFVDLMLDLNASPKFHIAYDREAYITEHNNEVRLTFDRNVRWQTRFTGEVTAQMTEPIYCTTDIVILELKFTGRFPNWYRDLVQTFNCFQTGAAKYMESFLMFDGRHQHPKDMVRNLVW